MSSWTCSPAAKCGCTWLRANWSWEPGRPHLCGSLLPAQPLWRGAERPLLRDRRICAACLKQLEEEKRGARGSWLV